MSIKKFVALSASLLSFVCADSNAKTVSFTGGAKLALLIQQIKNEVHVTPSAIESLLRQIGCLTDANNLDDEHKLLVSEVNDETINALLTDNVLKDYTSNLLKIIATRYERDTSSNPKLLVQQWQYEMSHSFWNNAGKMVFGGEVFVFGGVKVGNATFKLGVSADLPIVNKKIKTSFAAPSSKGSSQKNDDKSSNNKVNTDIEETKKFGYGFGGEVSFDINDCVSVGCEGGVKKVNSEFDVTKVNQNLFGTYSTPTYAKDTVVKENTKNEVVLAGQRSTADYPVINKINASLWLQYFGLTVGFNINKHLSAGIALGLQSGGEFTLKNEKKAIKYPDFRITQKGGFYGKVFIGIRF